MDYTKLFKDVINKSSLDLYILAAKDIKRSMDDLERGHGITNPSLEDGTFEYPKYIVVEKTKNGYFELLTQLPIGTINSHINSAVYFDYSGDTTIKKIVSEQDIKKCYDGNFDKEYLTDVASIFFDFYQTGLSAKNSSKQARPKINIKKYN